VEEGPPGVLCNQHTAALDCMRVIGGVVAQWDMVHSTSDADIAARMGNGSRVVVVVVVPKPPRRDC